MTGIRNELWVQSIAFDGDAFTLGTAELATGEWAPSVHAPAITHVTGNVTFVAWSEGTSPDFRWMGVFLELE